jgi:hypothetical protein
MGGGATNRCGTGEHESQKHDPPRHEIDADDAQRGARGHRRHERKPHEDRLEHGRHIRRPL